MTGTTRAITLLAGASLGAMVAAQAVWAEAWVQIEAQPSLAQAEKSARDWATALPDVAGYAMTTGWYAIALGPFADEAAADEALRKLRREGLIPRDSYIADGTRFGGQFWPVGAALAAPQAPVIAPVVEPPAAELAPPAPITLVETLDDSRRLEAALSREARMDIQAALQWAGFYASSIDGAFGRGTRASIAAWQEAQGFEATGVLTSSEQAQLLETVAAERTALGLTLTEEAQAGIAIELPLGLVEFDRYDPPFVQYRAKDGSGVTVLLISQPGDQSTLFGLYDAMQTLELVPMTGERERTKSGFTLTGQNDRLHSYTEASLNAGLIKGFTLAWPAGDEARMARVLEAMKASFKPIGTTALDPTLGKPMEVSRSDLLSGLDVRHPEFARSGFFITEGGAVLTAGAGLATCGRITIEDVPATLALADEALGIAVLTPTAPLAPPAVATFETLPVQAGAAVSVAGFSYPEALSAPVLSFGTLSDLSGLAGEASHARLALATLPGDAGGPVLDGSGAVVGVVLARAGTPVRLLPDDLSEAVQAMALAPLLAEKGFAPKAAEGTGTLATEDIAALARGFTVQVSCWK